MNKNLFFIACFLLSVPAFAQYPGGLNTGLKVWLKANSGITPVTNTVPIWNEVSGAGITGNFSATINPYSVTAPGYLAAGVNFNPHVIFNAANSNSMSSLNQFVGTDILNATANTVFQVIRLRPMGITGVWFKWQYANNGPRFGNEQNTTPLDKIGLDFPGMGAPRTYTATSVTNSYKVVTYGTETQRTIRLNGILDGSGATATLVPGTTPGRLSLGGEPSGTAGPFEQYFSNIDIAEVIVYNRTLTAAERNKVESYLAVKYGATLDQGAVAANDYVSSTGTVIWNRTANLPFTNNITGIGRDDGDSLVQRQSKSINAGAGMVTMYNGSYTGATAPAQNTLNTNNFPVNNSYLLFGDNGLALTSTRCFTTSGTGFLRMNRVWKAQKTGTVNTVTVAINAADVPANTRHLLVSTDSAFTPGATTVYRLDQASAVLSKAITFNNANSYFTFASDTLIARPTSNSPICEGTTLQLNSNIAGLTSYSWTGPNGFTSILPNPTIPVASLLHTGTYTLNAAAGTCVLDPATVKVTVSPRPAPPTVTTPLIYCEGTAAPALTAVGSNISWYSQPVGGAGTTTPPIPNTIYEDTIVYWVTQSVGGCESIRSRQEIQIRYRPNGVILGTQASICQGDVDTFNFFGNTRSTAQFDFKTPGSSRILSGSGPGPYIVRFDSAGIYKIRMQANNNGCVGDESFFTVTVRPSPAVLFTNKPDACLDEIVNVALYYTTSNVTNYSYDFAGGQIAYGTATGGPYGIAWSTPGAKVIKLVATTIGCSSRTTYDTIVVHPYPDARIRNVSKTSICTGDSVVFTASERDSNSRFYWTPDNFFNSGNIYQATGTVKKDGYVKLNVVSKWGCQSADSVYISAKPCCELFFPNVFSPNNDGKNDDFKVVSNGHHNISNFRIVNRWGQTVFETKDETRAWDGTYNGKPQDVGTYYYYIRYQCSSNEYFEQKGEVLLLR